MHVHSWFSHGIYRPRRALTLIELLIVVAILGIAALLVVPATGSSQEVRLRAAARLLIADLEYAQTASIGNGADPLVIVFDTANAAYHLAHRSDPTTPATNPASGSALTTTFGQGRAAALTAVTFDAMSVGGDEILGFSALGALDQSADATITLRCGTASIDIMVDAATGEPAIN